MIQKSATRTESTGVDVSVKDFGARKLTLAHLRAFVEQADLAGFPEDIEVRFEKKLQATSPYSDIRIEASTRDVSTFDIQSDES